MTLHQLAGAFGVCVLASALVASVRWLLHWLFGDRCDDPGELPEMDLLIPEVPKEQWHLPCPWIFDRRGEAQALIKAANRN